MHVEVLTPRYSSTWPEKLSLREIAVHRPAVAPRSDWSLGRYVRHLTQWLRSDASSFDVLLVDAIRDEALAAIEYARSSGCSTIVRCGGWGEHSDTQWWASSRNARRCGSMGKLADAVVAKSAVCQRALLADGYKADQVHRIDDGFAASPARIAASRSQARRSLAMLSSDLATKQDTPVVLCASRMTREGGVNLLVRGAGQLVLKYPDLSIWFIGDGPHRDWIYESLRGDGLRASIAMPGTFCDPSDLLSAADVFVQPDDDGLEAMLPAAVAAELPIVTVDTNSTRSVLGRSPEASELVQWCPGATAKYLRLGLLNVLDDLPAAQAQAAELKRLLVRTQPQSKTIADYAELIEQLVRQKPPRPVPLTKAVS
jgi:glycosyltransferase involved in cell wall biosynthesis